MLPAHGRCGAYARCISTLIGMPAGSDRGWSTPILTWLAPCMGIAADPATLSCGGGWAVCCSGGLGVGGWLVKTRPTTSRSRAHTASTSPRYASWSTRTSRGPTSGCTSFRPMSSTAWPLATTKTAPRISPVRRCFFLFFLVSISFIGDPLPRPSPDPSLPRPTHLCHLAGGVGLDREPARSRSLARCPGPRGWVGLAVGLAVVMAAGWLWDFRSVWPVGLAIGFALAVLGRGFGWVRGRSPARAPPRSPRTMTCATIVPREPSPYRLAGPSCELCCPDGWVCVVVKTRISRGARGTCELISRATWLTRSRPALLSVPSRTGFVCAACRRAAQEPVHA